MMAAATIALALGSAAPALAQQPPIYLKLNEAIGLAFARNLDLKVELYNPAMAESDIQRALGIYDPLVSAGVNYSRTVSPNTFTFVPFKIDQFTATAGVSQLLPTGGSVGLTTDTGWVSNSSSYWSNDYNLTVSQPLLKNFGREATELNIAVARVNKEGTVDRFRTRLSDTVAQVRNDYFKFYFLRENLEVNRTALALSQKILDETKGRVKAGVLPAMEILSAEFSVATREKAVIDAERALRDQMDVLRLELQLDPDREIVIVDQPTKESLQVAEPEALALAVRNRPEIAAQLATIKVNDLQQKVARNRTLPDLSLNANVGTAGFSDRFTRAYEKAISADDPVWGVGLQFSYPIGNRAAENDYIRSKLTLEQSQAQLQSLEAGIANDVKTSIRLLVSSYKQIDVTARGRAYAEERLRAFRKRNAVGLATAKDVFDVENDLITAEGNQIQALVDYNNAITQLWHVTGELLERQGIKLSERVADPLYQRDK
jgi:outer membrane protein